MGELSWLWLAITVAGIFCIEAAKKSRRGNLAVLWLRMVGAALAYFYHAPVVRLGRELAASVFAAIVVGGFALVVPRRVPFSAPRRVSA